MPELAFEMAASARIYPHTFAAWASDCQWTPARHLKYIGRIVGDEIRKGKARIIINLPPRHGKSELCSKWMPTWFLENWPRNRVIMTSYGAVGAEDWGRKVRDEFATNKRLRTKLREDVRSVSQWYTQAGGSMLSAGIGGSIMGFGYDCGFIDDPIRDVQEAWSPALRQAQRDWFDSVFYYRREPGASIVLIMHRWHPEDLAGYLIKHHTDKWTVIKLPAIAKDNDPLGRKSGEALWPERYPIAELEATRRANPMAFEALYQQEPPSELMTRAYGNYTDELNLDDGIQTRDDLPLVLAFDFNVNPGMHVIVGQYDKIRDTAYAIYEIHGPRMKTLPAMEEFGRWVERRRGFKFPCVHIHGDRSGKSQNTTTSQTDYEIIAKYLDAKNIPWKMKVPNANPPIKDRVDCVNNALRDSDGGVHLKIHSDCKRLLADFREQCTDEDGLPDKSNQLLGHAGDLTGYWLHWIRPIRIASFVPSRVSY